MRYRLGVDTARASTPSILVRRPGLIAGLFFGEAFGSRYTITVDMGGTSFDISLSKNGKTKTAKDFDFLRYRIGIPMLQVETLGAGGGSIAFVNATGLLQVGPESAGAQPGPAAYGRGGKRPTVTDALVVLGYLNPQSLLGGRLQIDADAARRVVAEGVAAPLKLSVEQAALGIFQLVNADMVSGIRRVSIEEGHDPHDFVLVVGGGAGPAHAGMLASELGVRRIMIPKVASTFCAFGEIIFDIKHNYLSSYISRLDQVDYERLNRLFAEMEGRGRQELVETGIAATQIATHRSLEMRYVDQIHECQVDIPTATLTPQNIAQVAEAFHRRHEELFTYSERGNTVEIINLETTVLLGRVERSQLPALARGDNNPQHAHSGARLAFFPEVGGFVLTSVFDGAKLLVGNAVQGSAIIEEATTTIIVFPGWQVQLTDRGMYCMTPQPPPV